MRDSKCDRSTQDTKYISLQSEGGPVLPIDLANGPLGQTSFHKWAAHTVCKDVKCQHCLMAGTADLWVILFQLFIAKFLASIITSFLMCTAGLPLWIYKAKLHRCWHSLPCIQLMQRKMEATWYCSSYNKKAFITQSMLMVQLILHWLTLNVKPLQQVSSQWSTQCCSVYQNCATV